VGLGRRTGGWDGTKGTLTKKSNGSAGESVAPGGTDAQRGGQFLPA
jgi:hypothetical protein